jgi:hypothetical protein
MCLLESRAVRIGSFGEGERNMAETLESYLGKKIEGMFDVVNRAWDRVDEGALENSPMRRRAQLKVL